MAKNKELNWCFTCEFSTFAQAYTGMTDKKAAAKFMADNDWISSVGEPVVFLTASDLLEIWDKMVEIRPHTIMENNGIMILNLMVTKSTTEAIELECDCVDAQELIKSIADVIFE